MEEQINLWPYIKALVLRWPWIVGASVLAAGATFIIITLLPTSYESTSLVAIINPEVFTLESLTIQNFDPSFQTEPDINPFINVYPELALGDAIVNELLSQYQSKLENVDSVEKLRRLLSVQIENNNSVLRFTVLNTDPELAASIASSWVNLFIPKANNSISIQRAQKLEFFEEQLDQADNKLSAVENTLTQFQSRNRLLTIENSLDVLLQAQTDYSAQLERLKLLKLDVKTLYDQIEETSIENITTADQLTFLFLQLRAFNVDYSSSSSLQISLDETLKDVNRQDYLTFLSNLLLTLDLKSEQITEILSTLEPEILMLQEQKQEAEVEQSQLMRQLSTAEEAYTAIVRRVVEERISAEEPINTVQLISEPTVPTEPIDANRLLNTTIAGAFAFLATSFLLLGNVWWEQLIRKHQEANDE